MINFSSLDWMVLAGFMLLLVVVVIWSLFDKDKKHPIIFSRGAMPAGW